MTHLCGLAVAAAVTVALTGCSLIGDRGATAPTATATEAATGDPTGATADASGVTPPAGTPRPAPGEIEVEVFAGVSEVTADAADVPASDVEVAIAEILSGFDTQQTDAGSVVTLEESVLFDFDSATLKPEAAPVLDRISEALVLAGKRRITIRGHTDSRGDDAYNLDLSTRRATAVRDYFVSARGLLPDRFEVVGVGEAEPVAANERPDGGDDPEGRQRNRRVEVVLPN